MRKSILCLLLAFLFAQCVQAQEVTHGFYKYIRSADVAAAGNSQGTAAAITGRFTVITGADGTKGVILPATPGTGRTWEVINGANAILKVYPGSGDTINSETANTPARITPYASFRCISGSNASWVCGELPLYAYYGILNLSGNTASKIVPGATSLSIRNAADGRDNLLITDAGAVTSYGPVAATLGSFSVSDPNYGYNFILGSPDPVAAGNSQGTATAITNRVAWITGADGTKGVILPATPAVGSSYRWFNFSASILKIYPGSGDTINYLANDIPITVQGYSVTDCDAYSTALWFCKSTPNYTTDGILNMSGLAASKIVPGVTSFAIRNNADGQNNVLVTDAGAVTTLGKLTVTAGIVDLAGLATSKIVPGATSFAIRNTADGQDNLKVVDAGNVTAYGTMTTTTGSYNVTASSTGYNLVKETPDPLAAGNSQGTATAITGRLAFIGSADGTKGVILPATPEVGATYQWYNAANAVLKVYPGSGDQIYPLGADNAASIAAYATAVCTAYSAALWMCYEGSGA